MPVRDGDAGVVVLCGGFGAARFLTGLARVAPALTCVVNTADDVEYSGLHVSPDVDSVCYALAGRFDEERGWGITGDTFRCAEALRRYGGGWFLVGDQDLAHNLRRTRLLRSGQPLSAATASLASALGIGPLVLPMSDDAVRTHVITDEGRLAFQDYLVRRQGRPAVVDVVYDGIIHAAPGPGVVDALTGASVILIAPSNPVASIGPMLALSGIRDALSARAVPTVAVTPIVSGVEPVTLAERRRAAVRAGLMAARGLEHRAAAAARSYVGLVDGFVLDQRDAGQRGEIEALGMSVLLTDTLVAPRGRRRFAGHVLEFARSFTK